MDHYFSEHLKDLSDRAYYTGRSVFSTFLTPEEQSEAAFLRRELIPFELFGGHEGCERKVIRFGTEKEIDAVLPFPITVLKASPVNEKFADELKHRDFLGALMNLGIERSKIGDIVVRDKTAYIFALEDMSEYICENFNKVKNTVISCSVCDSLPEGALYTTETLSVILSSMRLDCIISALLNISRSKCDKLFSEKKVFVNSVQTENKSLILTENTVISVRGSGKFKILDISGNTKKGKTVLNIAKYI